MRAGSHLTSYTRLFPNLAGKRGDLPGVTMEIEQFSRMHQWHWLGGWMQYSKLWTLKGNILHFYSMQFLPADQL